MSTPSLPLPPDDAGEEIAARKAAARRDARAARAAIDPAGAADALIARFDAAFPELAAGTVVSAYWPRGDELDVRPLLRHLAVRGCRTCLPVMAGRGWPLLFRLWRDGHPLVPAAFGVMEPMQEAPLVRPDIVLVPLLAWDGRGMRLGYGAGFYDRTLAALRAEGPVLAVGLAYEGQRMETVPVDGFDAPLDMLLTERRVLRFGTPTGE